MEELAWIKPKLIKDLGVIYATTKSPTRKRYGIFECPVCSKHYRSSFYHINKGNSKNCGCTRGKMAATLFTKHGDSATSRIYSIYLGIKKRCYNFKDKSYSTYGAKGVKMCELWLGDYLSFKSWALENGYTEDLTIDRIDINKGYSPENCRWSNSFIQAQNKSVNTIKNKTGYKGVSFRHKYGKTFYEVSITAYLKRIYLGRVNTAEQGALLYNDYVIKNKLAHSLNIIKEIND